MKTYINTGSFKGLTGSLLVLAIMMSFISAISAQGFNQKYNVYLLGQLTNDVNGAPLKNHAVTIVSDTLNEPGFFYTRTVFTDYQGYYYDTILTTLEKGALVIHTKDHQDIKYDTVVHYRFTWSESTILFANFVLPAPPLISVYQANFSYDQNPAGTNVMEYKFNDLSTAFNSNIISWSWDFGDGLHSQEQSPTHAYSDPGLYKVELMIQVQSGTNSEPMVSKIIKFINVTKELYFHMGGHVFAGYFPIDKSEVYLYKIEGNVLVPIDTALFNDDLGYFLFYQLIEGEYILKADLHPQSELFNMFMPTYYSDKLHWDEADTIFHYYTNFEYDINLAPNTQAAASGPGTIEGLISYDPTYGGGKSAPAENISILLYDSNDQAVNICHSNENGQFTLNQLDLQMYYVYAEVTGITTLPVQVVLEDNMNGMPTVTLVIDNQYVSGAVNAGVDDHILDQGIGNPFPNPSEEIVSLELDLSGNESISGSILNISGQAVQSFGFSATPGTSLLRWNVSELPEGVYFIRLEDQSGRNAIRKFVKK